MKGSRTQELGDKLVFLDKGSAADDGPLYEDILITVGQGADDLKAFNIQSELNQKIWDGDKKIRPGVKGALMDIIEEFMESLDLDIDLKDVVITGSLANYNWSKFSDVDLHIIIDFAEVDENFSLVKEYFNSRKSLWNLQHEIMIHDFEVEIYVQDEKEPHASTGVYSIFRDGWVTKPLETKAEIDFENVKKKAESLMRINREKFKLSDMTEKLNKL